MNRYNRRRCAVVGAMISLTGCASPLRDDPPARAYGNGAPNGAAAYARANGMHGASAPAASVSWRINAEPNGAPLPDRATLDDVLAYAQAHSAAMLAAQERWRMLTARIDQSRSLPDPRISYMQERDRRPHEQEIMVSQAFPWFGTLGRRRDAAAREADAELARVSATWLSVRERVVEAAVELAYLERQIALTRDTLELLRQVEASIRARHTVQSDLFAQVVRAQVEIGRVENEVRTLEARRAPLRARLNAMLSRDDGDPLPTEWTLPDELLNEPDDRVLAMLDEHNPELRAMGLMVEALREGQEAARLETRPEFEIGVGGDATEDTFIASISMSIPLWGEKNKARVREATSARIVAAYERDDARHRLRADAADLLFQHGDAQRRIAVLRSTLIPKAEEAMRATLACCAAGTAGFLDALDAERTLLALRLEEARALADRATTLVRLESLTGAPLARVSDGDNTDTHEHNHGVEQ